MTKKLTAPQIHFLLPSNIILALHQLNNSHTQQTNRRQQTQQNLIAAHELFKQGFEDIVFHIKILKHFLTPFHPSNSYPIEYEHNTLLKSSHQSIRRLKEITATMIQRFINVYGQEKPYQQFISAINDSTVLLALTRPLPNSHSDVSLNRALLVYLMLLRRYINGESPRNMIRELLSNQYPQDILHPVKSSACLNKFYLWKTDSHCNIVIGLKPAFRFPLPKKRSSILSLLPALITTTSNLFTNPTHRTVPHSFQMNTCSILLLSLKLTLSLEKRMLLSVIAFTKRSRFTAPTQRTAQHRTQQSTCLLLLNLLNLTYSALMLMSLSVIAYTTIYKRNSNSDTNPQLLPATITACCPLLLYSISSFVSSLSEIANTMQTCRNSHNPTPTPVTSTTHTSTATLSP